MGRLGMRAIPIVACLALAIAAGCGSGSSSSGGGGGNAGAPVNISTCHAPVGHGQFTIVSEMELLYESITSGGSGDGG